MHLIVAVTRQGSPSGGMEPPHPMYPHSAPCSSLCTGRAPTEDHPLRLSLGHRRRPRPLAVRLQTVTVPLITASSQCACAPLCQLPHHEAGCNSATEERPLPLAPRPRPLAVRLRTTVASNARFM